MTKIIAIFAAALVFGITPSLSTPRYEYAYEWNGLDTERALAVSPDGYVYTAAGWDFIRWTTAGSLVGSWTNTNNWWGETWFVGTNGAYVYSNHRTSPFYKGLIARWTKAGSLLGTFYDNNLTPMGITWDGGSYLYVTYWATPYKVRKFTTDLQPLASWGVHGLRARRDGRSLRHSLRPARLPLHRGPVGGRSQ